MRMVSTALLHLSTIPSALTVTKISEILYLCTKHASQHLYVYFDQPTTNNISAFCDVSTKIYSNTSMTIPSVNILLSSLKTTNNPKLQTRFPFDVIITDKNKTSVLEAVNNKFCQTNVENIPVITIDDLWRSSESFVNSEKLDWTVHPKVVMGGTFDRLHTGHKVLLTHAVLKCSKKLTIGVTAGSMNKRKTLCELIEPIQDRMMKLREFLEEVDPTIDYEIVEIIDPFGPSTVDPDLTCIVVSAETLQGGEMVNAERQKKGMRPLEIWVVDLVEDSQHKSGEEIKYSSSSVRRRALGQRIRPTKPRTDQPLFPYIIGLTGGIASGKSSIAERLERLGAHVINCDKLAHRTYQQGLAAYRRIIEEFGKEVVLENGEINRKALGAIVFSNRGELDKLNGIVWPEIGVMVDDIVTDCRRRGVKVVILDAAVLLEAGWDGKCQEVWVSVIPTDEAIRRIQSRDGLSSSDAERRVQSQMSNESRVAAAHLVFSTLWEPEFTQQQVERAWRMLQEELKLSSL